MNRTRAAALGIAVTFAIAACGGGGGSSPEPAPGAPAVSLSAEPSSVVVGSTATLNWSSVDAAQCAASGGWSGARATSGSEGTSPLTQSTSFTLSCTGAGGTTAKTVNVAVSSQLLSGVTLPGFPHQIDVYRAAGATRAVVFLHGGGGRNYQFSNQLGINLVATPPTNTDVDWPWLEVNHVLAVFPQGQRQTTATGGYTWNNHVMQSGQDDVAFLQALASHIASSYGITDIAVVGHSNGGMMANRMWCESPGTFDAYVAIAGPASAHYLDPATPCLTGQVAPYYGIVGDRDNVLQVTGNWDASTWTINPAVVTTDFVDPTLIGEWRGHQARSSNRCGTSVTLGDATSNGVVDTWSNCSGSILLDRVVGAGHQIDSIQSTYGTSVRDLAVGFLDSQ